MENHIAKTCVIELVSELPAASRQVPREISYGFEVRATTTTPSLFPNQATLSLEELKIQGHHCEPVGLCVVLAHYNILRYCCPFVFISKLLQSLVKDTVIRRMGLALAWFSAHAAAIVTACVGDSHRNAESLAASTVARATCDPQLVRTPTNCDLLIYLAVNYILATTAVVN